MTDAPFVFERYGFDAATGQLRLHYGYEGGASFEEVISFPAPCPALPPERSAALDRAFRLIFLLAGISYYKAYAPRDLICRAFPLSQEWADFIATIYRHGLGEFAFRNKISLKDHIQFATANAPHTPATDFPLPHHYLVPVGGGKDSIVSIETLRQSSVPITLYAQGKAASDIAVPIEATLQAAGLPALRVGRTLSPVLLQLNKKGALNGHVPITAILSSITVACALLYGFDTIILSNEHSASAPNMTVDGVDINHQYSKSYEFEQNFADFVHTYIAKSLHYFSLLRPLTEAAITRRFAKHTKYHPFFRSCNTAFRQDKSTRGSNWCCDCPKCRFVFLALAPFMGKNHLVEIFGRNMLDDTTQAEGFAELCGLISYKPFECVGEVEESALLMVKLGRMPEWRTDKIVGALAPQLVDKIPDFETSYNNLFTLRTDHNVPHALLELLHAGG